MVSDHLPGGKFHEPSSALVKQSASAKSHNKLPEFIFGQLDNLLRYRPNASTLANESLIMYSHNKTRQWLNTLTDEERVKVMEDSRKEGRELRQLFKDRLKEIDEKKRVIQQEKQKERERIEKDRIKKAEGMTNDVCLYGLWQTRRMVEEGLARLESEAEKRKGLEAQLKFRKTVLKQKHQDKKVFNLSAKQADGKYKKLSLDSLCNNLMKLIDDAVCGETVEQEEMGILLVGKFVRHTFGDGVTYPGKVISVVPGFPSWYNIIYDIDKDKDAVYAFNLRQDYKEGNLVIVV